MSIPTRRAVHGAAPSSPSLPSDFASLGLLPAFVRAVADEGYSTPTPIQERAIPHAIEGRDLVACAQTGTGKTAAFVLPMLQRLGAEPRSGRIRALVVTPTRELAAQIAERVTAYGRHGAIRHVVIYGGVGQRPQEDALRKKPDLVVATPGRLLDLMGQGHIDLSQVRTLVLDEADRMLDMGFLPDVKRIIAAVPRERQTLLFSATMPGPIAELAKGVLRDPIRVSVTPQATAAETVTQTVYLVAKSEKRALLERLLRTSGIDRAIVFTRTKHGANRVAEQLSKAGIDALPIHGNKSQNARDRALSQFRSGVTPVLVATDLAARGIDVDGVSHVINYELPNVAEQYVHRIGRTGRAGATGAAFTFCDPAEERGLLADIEKMLGSRIPLAEGGRIESREPPRESRDAPRDRDSRDARPFRDDGRGPRPQRPVQGRPASPPARSAPSRSATASTGPNVTSGAARGPAPGAASSNEARATNDAPAAPRRRRSRRRYRGAKVA